ncbi:hypothetical protein L6164_026137 [Bauhinia variegata]|uniref:Uncharacterized protein n=1 Tax=Bauhinia variegata TaxID=167791 RepID=A0ACB9LQQ5_BAUVA|nr:hypothetical protein L6164_026137 [Bauhinia variegata]
MMRKEDQGFHPFLLKVLPNPPLELVTPEVIVKVLASFPHQSNHVVLWNYGAKVEMVKGKLEDQGASQKDDGVTNVGVTARFTISGRKALQKFLDQAYVNPSITVENFNNMVNLIKKVDTISFKEDELMPKASKHTIALHIALKCVGCIVAKSSNIVVRAFDGTRRDVLGDIVLPLEISPSKFNVVFQVMDIEPAYTMLLGRLWIHAAGAVSSTLHQKLKYINNGRVITMKGEEDLLMSKPNNLPYVEAADKALENSFQTLELEHDTINRKVVHMMRKNGFQQGKGLGTHLQGINALVSLPENVGRQELGYSSLVDPKENNLSNRNGTPNLCQTFTKSSDIMASLKDEDLMPVVNILGEGAGGHLWIRPCMEDENLDNWEMELLQDLIYFE